MGVTALHYAAYFGKINLVKYLIENGKAVITTQDSEDRTPISDAVKQGHTKIALYLKAQVLKMIMGIDLNLLPFFTGVRSIIAKYLH